MTCCSTFDGYIWHLLICLNSHWSTYLQKARFFASIKKQQISSPSDHCVFCGLTNPFFSKCHTNNPDIQQCDIYLCLFYYLWSDIRVIMNADFECVLCMIKCNKEWFWNNFLNEFIETSNLGEAALWFLYHYDFTRFVFNFLFILVKLEQKKNWNANSR